ncbi:MAG: hypothetical protein IJ816_02235 [Alloprevotella sp.]|nr:hypothetical protein [Alloprevotella sp.]
MKKTVAFVGLLCCVIGMVILNSCHGCQGRMKDCCRVDSDSVESVLFNDSTIYGTTLEYGMSTFVVRTDAGDTLELDREGNGTIGEIFGNLDRTGDRFALTVVGRNTDTPSVRRAINVTDLRLVSAPWEIENAQLIIEGDTVTIQEYTPTLLCAEGRSGRKYRYEYKPAVLKK